MPDEGPLEHYLTVSHEPEPDISEPAPERSPGPWRERGIMLGLGFLLGCIRLMRWFTRKCPAAYGR
ncbi:MAG: hypothetical protein ACLT8C_02560 [Akkermansia muciniphila]